MNNLYEEYNYKLEKQDKSGGDYTESKDIITTKTITLKTNNTQKILKEFPIIMKEKNGEKSVPVSLSVGVIFNEFSAFAVKNSGRIAKITSLPTRLFVFIIFSKVLSTLTF